MKKLHILRHQKADGRMVSLYDWQARDPVAVPESAPEENVPGRSYMRWHPLRREWVAYASARQNRTFKPPAEFCPLCPSRTDKFPSEIPFESFEIAVFDNKFPAFSPSDFTPDLNVLPTRPANGKCEVVVYSADHHGNIGTLSVERIELLLEVWIDRYEALRGKNGIEFVMPFENRGEEAGVTLHHPHGQIYGFPHVPPVIENAVKGFAEGYSLSGFLAEHGDRYAIFRDAHVSAFLPPFARYSYEMWIAANRPVPGPWAFTANEKRSFAQSIKNVVALYDTFFERPCPYVFVLHAAPVGCDDTFEFSAQFYPLLRTPQKLKYLAGCELGAGVFLNDVQPEEAVEKLRSCLEGIKR